MKEIFDNWQEQLLPWLLTHGIKIAFIAIGAYILNKILAKVIEKAVKIAVVPDKSVSKDAEKKREDTLVRIFTLTNSIIISVMAVLMVLQEAGVPIGPILAGAGIIGLAVGFGGQYLIRDIISGLFIVLENQYRIGDVVTLGDSTGLVEDISLRMTTLRDLDGIVHHIPHGEIKKVSNRTKFFSRVNLNIGVSYNSRLEHVIEVINKTGNQMAQETEWRDIIIKPPQFFRVDDFADSAITIKILGETITHKQMEVTSEFRKRIKIAFDKEGIEIPFPQRVIHYADSKKEK